jgi:hypothetical protein
MSNLCPHCGAERDEIVHNTDASPDPEAARELAHLMSCISEECWCAGWLSGTEYDLWDAIKDTSNPYEWGLCDIPEEMRRELKPLSDRCNGWIVCHEDLEFVQMDEWIRMVRP